MLVTGQLRPGSLLSEAALSSHLGIGRTPVRETLKLLARDNMLTVLPRRGIMVTEIDVSQLLLVLEVRRCLERVLVTRAARRSGTQERTAFQDIADRLEKALHRDLSEYMRIDRELDDLVDYCAANPYATESLRPLHALFRRFWFTRRGSDVSIEVGRHHIAVVRAIAAGDPRTAERASAALMRLNETFLRSLLD